MKSIITVTFHCAHNYGAVWQAYALQQYFIKNYPDYDIYCLDYRPEYLKTKLFKKSNKENILVSIVHNIITFKSRFLRKYYFDVFIKKYIRCTPYKAPMDDIENIFIVGSDQVWNKDITGGELDSIYCLERISKAKKYSYAASIASDNLDRIKEVYSRVADFNKIGIREDSTYRSLLHLGANNIFLNVDPVFLIDSSEYFKLLPSIKYKNYVLIYTLENNPEIKKILKSLSKEYMTISIGTFKNQYGTDKHFSCASPELFLALIANAEMVISNSFHTIAFSIIFNKDFKYIPLHNGRGSRIESLLKIMDLDGTCCNNVEHKKHILNEKIMSSKEYIKTIIEDNINAKK